MLTPTYIDSMPDPIVQLFEEFEQSIINDIARRLAGLHLSSAAWQVQRLSESGLIYENILSQLAHITHLSELELRDIFWRAGVRSMRFDDSVYKAAGLNPLPLNLSPAMAEVLAAGLRRTGSIMRNLTMTTAIRGQDAFIHAADLAYMQVSSGTMAYTQAVRGAVKRLAAEGIGMVIYPGRVDQMDVAMRRAVLTGVGQTTGELQMKRADEMGQDLVQTTAHGGARPTHQVWQGRIFSRSGTHPQYPDFVQSTGYGTGPGLMGWNCRHSFYPFFEGLSENAYDQTTLDEFAHRTVKYNGKEMSFYDGTQEQRGIERNIRYWKRQASALNAAGLDSGPETAKVKLYQAQMRDFVRQTKIVRQRERERI